MTRPTPDPFRLDRAALERLAGDTTLRRGLAAAEAGRVLSLAWTAHRLDASILDRRSPRAQDVTVHAETCGKLTTQCSCGASGGLCVHAVAALAAYRQQQEVTADQTRKAWMHARRERIDSAREGVEVRPLPGGLRWETRSRRSGSQPHSVTFYGGDAPIHNCTCVDYAINRLGTCKHVEAVRQAAGGDILGPKFPVVYLRWDPGGQAQVAVHLKNVPARGHAGWWTRCFDSDGALRVPVDALIATLEAHPEVAINPDVLVHVERLRDREAKEAEATRIQEAIQASGGKVDGLGVRLYPYQVEGVAFLAANGRAILADDMGLGKTVQTIGAVTWLAQSGHAERVLVVCPASIKWQWAAEIQAMTGDEAVVIDGPPAGRQKAYERRARWTIVNYELVLRDGPLLSESLDPDLLVLDEAQRVRNWRTKTATAIKRLKTERAFLLTGTPLENRLEDLYSLLQVVDQQLAGPLWQFELNFHVTDTRGRVLGYRNLSTLRERVRPVLRRRERRQVATQLPECVVQQRDLPLSPNQQKPHDDALREASRLGHKARGQGLTARERNALMSALQRARMACNAAQLVSPDLEGAPKLVELRRILEEVCVDAGRKVVVFSEWERMTRLAQDVVEGIGLGVVRLHGKVPTHRRAQLVARFWDEPDTRVFLATDAGSVGLNLQCASAVINLDLPWNPAVLDQRIGRVHRLGQANHHVDVILLVTTVGYEGKMAQTLQRKRALFEGVLSSDGGPEAVTMRGAPLGVALQTLTSREEEDGRATVSALREMLGDAAAERAPAPEASQSSTDHAAWARGVRLMERGEPQGAIAAFLACMVEVVSDRAGRAPPQESDDLATWLYRTIIPTGAINGRDAGFVLRAEALSRDANVSADLAEHVRDDTERLLKVLRS